MVRITLPRSGDNLPRWRAAFRRVGWFAPAYVSVGYLNMIAGAIEQEGEGFHQDRLQSVMATIYTPRRLAAMALHRYPQTHIVKAYSETIKEAVQAHLIGLHHIAIGGLVPVIEGIGKRFGQERGLPDTRNSTKIFQNLMDDYKREAIERQIGETDELTAMLDTFAEFATNNLYVDSAAYPLSDKTNRHGIVHGHYADSDYGSPGNFYKAISAIDVLTFTSIIRHPGSVFVPDYTPACAAFLECARAQAELRRKLVEGISQLGL
jgi:hypothetical protein